MGIEWSFKKSEVWENLLRLEKLALKNLRLEKNIFCETWSLDYNFLRPGSSDFLFNFFH